MDVHRRGGSPRRGRHLARVLCGVCTAAWLATASAAVAEQQPAAKTGAARPSFDDLYNRGQKANANIKTLTARFTETTSSSLLKGNIEQRGTLYVERPSRVVLRYDEPAGKVVLIDGDRMTTSWPSQKIFHTADVGAAQGRVQKYFVARDAGELRKIFDIRLHDTTERPGTHEVLMVPKQSGRAGKQIREALTGLELWVVESTGLLQAMRMTFANEDTKLMEFDHVVQNAMIDRAVFSAPK